MSGQDNEVRIKVSIDTEEVQKKLDAVDKQMQNLSNRLARKNNSIDNQTSKVNELKKAYDNLVKGATKSTEQLGIEKAIEKAQKKIAQLKREFEKDQIKQQKQIAKGQGYDEFLKKNNRTPENPTKPAFKVPKFEETDNYKKANEELLSLKENLKNLKANPASAESVQKLKGKLERSSNALNQLKKEASQVQNQIKELDASKPKIVEKETAKAQKKLEKENKKLEEKKRKEEAKTKKTQEKEQQKKAKSEIKEAKALAKEQAKEQERLAKEQKQREEEEKRQEQERLAKRGVFTKKLDEIQEKFANMFNKNGKQSEELSKSATGNKVTDNTSSTSKNTSSPAKEIKEDIKEADKSSEGFFSKIKSRLSEFGNKSVEGFKKFREKFAGLEKFGNKLGEALQKTANTAKQKTSGVIDSVGNSISKFGNRILQIAGYSFVFGIISAGFRNIRAQIGNLIQHDTMLNSSLLQVQANLATAFTPIWQAVLPALQAMAEGLSRVTAFIASFVSMLFGKTVQQSQATAKSYIAVSDTLGKQAKGYDKVGKSAKKAHKAKKELASFDKIEVLKNKNKPVPEQNQPTPSSGGSMPQIKQPEILGGFKDIDTNIIDKAREALERFKEPFKDWDLTELNESLGRFWGIVSKFSTNVGEGLWWFYTNVLAPIAKWTIGKLLPKFLNVLSATLEAINPIAHQVAEDLKWLWDTFLKKVMKWVGDKITDFLQFLADIITTLGKNISENKAFLEFISAFILGLGSELLAMLLWGVATALWGCVTATWAWTVALLANPITWVVIGIALLIAAIILCCKHWDDIKNAGKAACEAIANGFVVLVNKIISGINMVIKAMNDLLHWDMKFVEKWDLPFQNNDFAKKYNANGKVAPGDDWQKKIDELTSKKPSGTIPDYVNNPPIHIPSYAQNMPNVPKLAKGAVLAGGSPFLAILNDQPRGQVNIETPLKTMVEAFKTAFSELPQRDNPIIVEPTGDFAPFIRMLNLQIKKEEARVGQSFAISDSWI